MHIFKDNKDVFSLNHVSVSDEDGVTAVTKAVTELSKKGAFYPLTPTLYSSGAEGFVLSGFCKQELDEIAIRLDVKRTAKRMESAK